MSLFINCFRLITIIFFIIVLLNPSLLIAQNINTEKFQYLSPVPASKLNSPETNIIIRFGDAFINKELNRGTVLTVKGSKSGNHTGNIILAEDNKTLIFNPDKQFSAGEVVTVELNGNLKTISGKRVPSLIYLFEVSQAELNRTQKSIPERLLGLIESDLNINHVHFKNNSYKKPSMTQDSLPKDFPEIIIDTIKNPTPGYLFSSPFTYPTVLPTYLIINNNHGVPIFYRKMNNLTFDFKKQTTGVLTYFDTGGGQYYIMDSSYKIIDSLGMKNGYGTDLHELVILENNHALMMGYDIQTYAMDTVVEGGHPNATVFGFVIQELDENKNVIFQWRTWDHFKITDATYDIDLTDSAEIDYVHGNAIEMDYDGNILISSRHMDEITKINRETGEIMWRWGGIHCRNNEFTFINDPLNGFSHQHDIRRLPNGNLLLFDNGNLHNPQISRVVEYQVDEINKLAFLVWEFRNDPETYSAFMGSSRRLDNHNTIIGWGSWSNPAISEVAADGTVELQISFPDTLINYRAFKFPWKTNVFLAYPDSINFGYVPIGDSLTRTILIRNHTDQDIEINGILNRESAFSFNVSLPMIIRQSEGETLDVTFSPENEGNYTDDLHLQWNKTNERIAQVVPLFGTTDSTFIPTSVKSDLYKIAYSLDQNYPNPFNPKTTISYSIPEQNLVVVKVYDILGNEVRTLVNEVKFPGFYEVEFNAEALSSGIYIYTITAGSFHSAKKLMLLK